MIELRLDEAMDNPRHFEKVLWFARYWNDNNPALPIGEPGTQGLWIPPS